MTTVSAPQDGFVTTRFYGYTEGDGRNWVATQYFYWWWKGKYYRCVIGATTDGASTPQITWNVLPPFGWYWLAAICHDFGFRGMVEVLLDDGTWHRIQMAFSDCNQMIFDLMTVLQSKPEHEAEKVIIYQAVSKAGQSPFSTDLAQPITI